MLDSFLQLYRKFKYEVAWKKVLRDHFLAVTEGEVVQWGMVQISLWPSIPMTGFGFMGTEFNTNNL